MLQHLLNTSAIWLISLVLFDALLRKETFHTYNRIYLLFTFLLGIFLPFWTWHNDSVVYQTTLRAPIQQASVIRETIAQSTMPAHTSFNWDYYLWFIYMVGVGVSLVLLAREAIQLATLYRNGKKIKEAAWTIIETGKEHTPFSLFNCLFISDRTQYNQGEWDIICRHEEQHSASLHFIDIFIIQASRILFWFHPFVYIYNNRLLLIHEYQADSANTV